MSGDEGLGGAPHDGGASIPGTPPPPPGAAPGSAVPAGWYVDPYGQTRWWDGRAWGVTAPAPPSVADPRQQAMLCHVLAILTSFIGPLVLYSTTAKRDPFVMHHAAESLNFSITFLIATFACIPLMFLCIGFVLLPIIGVLALVWQIQGCIAANRGEWWRYPVNIRMVSGAVG
jgi:uncharacterized Tic20 family protein